MRILVDEDDAVLSQAMTRSLEQAGHRVDLARSVDCLGKPFDMGEVEARPRALGYVLEEHC
jgi:DNA-binding response OmpR family regulator